MLPQPAGNPPPLKGLRQHRFVPCWVSGASTPAFKARSVRRRGHCAAKRIGLTSYECGGHFLRPGCSGSGARTRGHRGAGECPAGAGEQQLCVPGDLSQPRTGVSFTLRAHKPLQFKCFLYKLFFSGNTNNNLQQYNRFCRLLWRCASLKPLTHF